MRIPSATPKALFLALPVLALGACGGGSHGDGDVSGAIGGATFGDDLTVFHGTKHIVIANTDMDCLDMAWVTSNYFVGDSESDIEFAAIQFTFDSDTPQVGTFSIVAGDGAVTGWSVLNLDVPADGPGTVEGERAQNGTLTIDSAPEDEESPVVGSFEAVFREGNAQGTFTTAYCRNLR